VVFKSLFEEVPMELCRYAAPLPDGGTVLAVSEGTPMRTRSHLMRFDKEWRPEHDFATLFEADFRSPLTLKRSPDGKFFFAGAETIEGKPFPGLVRLDEHGAIDHSFLCDTTKGTPGRVYNFAFQTDGRILICGDFSSVNGTPARHIARLNPDGSLDQTFRLRFVQLSEIHRQRSLRIARLSKKRSTLPGQAASAGTGDGAVDNTTPQTVLITSMNQEPGRAVFHFKGKPRQLYILQAREPLDPQTWINITSIESKADGSGVLTDSGSLQHPLRSYRIVTP
jgi:hypothetical protein